MRKQQFSDAGAKLKFLQQRWRLRSAKPGAADEITCFSTNPYFRTGLLAPLAGESIRGGRNRADQ